MLPKKRSGGETDHFDLIFEKKESHPGNNLIGKTHGNLEGFFSMSILQFVYPFDVLIPILWVNFYGRMWLLRICGRGASSLTKHSFQTIWTSHCLPQKKKTECPKEFGPKRSQKNGWSAIICLSIIFLIFSVFIIFLRIVIIIVLIIVLSPFSWFAGENPGVY